MRCHCSRELSEPSGRGHGGCKRIEKGPLEEQQVYLDWSVGGGRQ